MYLVNCTLYLVLCTSERISYAQTDHAFELAALADVAVFVGYQRARIVLQARLERDLQAFEELIAECHIPVHVKIAEIAVVVRIEEITRLRDTGIPVRFGTCRAVIVRRRQPQLLHVEALALVRSEQS